MGGILQGAEAKSKAPAGGQRYKGNGARQRQRGEAKAISKRVAGKTPRKVVRCASIFSQPFPGWANLCRSYGADCVSEKIKRAGGTPALRNGSGAEVKRLNLGWRCCLDAKGKDAEQFKNAARRRFVPQDEPAVQRQRGEAKANEQKPQV